MPLEIGGRIEGEDSTFSVAITREYTLRDVIEGFADLIVPGFKLQVPDPWNDLLSIALTPATMSINGTRIGFNVMPEWSVAGILDITDLGLWFDTDTHDVEAVLGGTLLGQPFADIKWDPVEQPTPPIETEDGKTFELAYLALGQHQEFKTDKPETMDAVMAALMKEPDLVFSADSGWLFGTRFSALDTLAMDLVFWDNQMYGMVVHLTGDRAASLAGLRFEILYRKISETLGVYHADLELPTVLRHLEMGAISATLPAVTVDIYTDGSFLIDLGFPDEMDFSRSFAVEVFPFVGFGGFYFGKLPEAATPSLPAVPDGARFDPIIAVGVGLSVGVGKTIEMGALSAGATVTLVGILEGLFAPYIDESNTQAGLYYHASGQVALVGHIYGAVNFGIIKAQVDILAYASMTLVLEAHQPSHVVLEAAVFVKLQVKVLFVTLDFSFEAKIREAFVIGAPSTPPWALPDTATRPLTMGMMTAVGYTPTYYAIEAATVVEKPVPITLKFAPQVTVGQDDAGSPVVDLVNMIFVDMPGGDADDATGFEAIFVACFEWASQIIAGDTDTLVPADLRRLQDQLGMFYQEPTPEQRLTPEKVLTFWKTNFEYHLEPWPPKDAPGSPAAALTVFPMNPEHKLIVSGPEGEIYRVDFADHKMCSPGYQEWIGQFFDDVRSHDEEPLLAAAPDGEPLAALLLVDYFRTVMKIAIGDALSSFDSFPFDGQGETVAASIA